MKAEYAKIVDDVRNYYSISCHSREYSALREVAERCAERCEALSNKPVRELTDEEIDAAYAGKVSLGELIAIRRVIAAHIAKQSEPDEIPFDQKRLDEGGWEVRVYHSDKQSFIFREDANKVTLVRKT